jgi:hypothetical protein
MTPREEIALLYWQYPQEHTFDTDERLHLATGYVIETDDALLIGRGVDSNAPLEMILSPGVAFPRSHQDMWFIWAYSGPLSKIYELRPYDLPLVGWIRHNRHLRIYDSLYIWKRCESRRITFTTLATRQPSS